MSLKVTKCCHPLPIQKIYTFEKPHLLAITFKIFSKSQILSCTIFLFYWGKVSLLEWVSFFSFSFFLFLISFFLSFLEEPIRIIIVKTYPLYIDDNLCTGELHKEIKNILSFVLVNMFDKWSAWCSLWQDFQKALSEISKSNSNKGKKKIIWSNCIMLSP